MKKIVSEFIYGLKHKNALLILGLVLYSVYLYTPTLQYPFIWDDEAQIVTNDLLRHADSLPKLFFGSTFDIGGGVLVGTYWRPLVSVSNFLNFQLWGLNPGGFRAYQLLFHSLVLVLIYFFLLRVGRLLAFQFPQRLAILTTAVYLVQPVHIESVVYIGSIGEVLYTFFSLLALFALLHSLKQQTVKRSAVYELVFFILFGAALLSKESAVVLIPIAALLAYMLRIKKKQFWLRFCSGSIVSIALYTYVRLAIAHVPFTKDYGTYISNASFLERLMTVPYILMSYIVKLLLPVRLLIYENTVIHTVHDPTFWLNALGVSMCAVLVVLAAFKLRSSVFIFFILWFCISLMPILNIYGIDFTVADRWMYFPAIGFYGALCTYITLTLRDNIKRPLFLSVCIIALLAYSGRTLVREQYWHSAYALYGHDVRSIPSSFELLNNYALELVKQGRLTEARMYLERAVQLRPGWFVAETNLGMVYHRLGLFDLAEKQYLKVRTKFENPITLADLVSLYIDTKEYDRAQSTLLTARRLFPTYKRLIFLDVLLEYKLGDKNKALIQMQQLLNTKVLDRDIQEFLLQAEKVQ
jgi:hypothetical protein